MNKHINLWSRKELMALPVRPWGGESLYDSLLLTSTRKKHDSGWAVIAIIGVVKNQPHEIAACCCDDIEWKFPTMVEYGKSRYTIGQVRMDCAMKSGAMHFWQRNAKFKVGMALSSTTVEMICAEES